MEKDFPRESSSIELSDQELLGRARKSITMLKQIIRESKTVKQVTTDEKSTGEISQRKSKKDNPKSHETAMARL